MSEIPEYLREDELTRILALPVRPPLDCSRQPGSKLWSPSAEALVEVISRRYARPTVSCACADRRVTRRGDRALVLRLPPPGLPPLPPENIAYAELCRDVLDGPTRKQLASLRDGETIELAGLGRPCIRSLNPIQAWALREFPRAQGIFGLVGVGSGKCLAAGNEVFDVRAARRRDVSEHGALSVSSMGADYRIAAEDATCFSSGQKPCRKIVLADGTAAVASDDHPVFTSRGWVHSVDLAVGDFVAVASRVPEPAHPTAVSDDEVKLIAYLLADGSCAHSVTGFTNMTPAVLAEVEYLAKAVFGGGISDRKSRSRARELLLHGTGPRFGKGGRLKQEPGLFRDRWNLNGLAKEKRLHPALWGLPNRQIGLFLNRFWACDGYIESGKRFGITLASEKMIDDLQFLLLRLGIRARKHHKLAKCEGKTFDAWRLTVPQCDTGRFLFSVGDVLGKEATCAAVRARYARTKRNTNVDIVPIGKKDVTHICDDLGFERGNRARGKRGDVARLLQVTTGQYVSRASFISFCRAYDYRGRYAHLASDDLRWERVEQNFDAGVREVHDLSVPATSNFVVNSGMVVHNTILSLLAPLAVDCKTAIILIKPDQRIHYRAAYLRLREHFRVPSLVFDRNDAVDTQGAYIIDGAPVAHVIPYSLLSNPKSTMLLEQIAADTVIADEWHLLANRASTRTTRFLRFMAKEPCKRLAGWSGSTIKKSVKDAAHLAAHSLGLSSPYPIKQDDAEAFGAVIDPSPTPDRTSSTARRLFAAFGRKDLKVDDPAFSLGLCGDGGIREGFRARVFSTLGVIATSTSSAPCSLTIRERVIQRMPDDVRAKLDEARLGRRPDGEELTEAVEISACARTVAAGYYHYWAYPRNEPVEIREDWFAKRQAWNRELRAKLLYGEPHLDSPHLCANAAERAWREPRYEGPLPVWPADTWPAWVAIRDAIQPDPRSRVFDDFLAADAAAWAKEHRGIVWVQSRALGQRIAELAGINYHGGGPEAEARIRAEDGKRSIVASLKAHGESRDELQFKFCKQLFAELMSSADRWEQALGRLVRQGQPADTVETWIYRHVAENRDAFRNAVMYAEYIEATTPNKQLILAADCEFEI